MEFIVGGVFILIGIALKLYVGKRVISNVTKNPKEWAEPIIGKILPGKTKQIIAKELTNRIEPKVGEFLSSVMKPKSQQWSLELIKAIEWKLFEDLCAAYLNEIGYKANTTGLGADGGVDVLAYKNDELFVVQCKSWKTKQAGVKETRELRGVMHSMNAKGCILMASGKISKAAEEDAKANKMYLFDGVHLLAGLNKLSQSKQQALLEKFSKGDYTTPSCVSCGTKMVKRKGGMRDFWGCMNFPRCRNTIQISS